MVIKLKCEITGFYGDIHVSPKFNLYLAALFYLIDTLWEFTGFTDFLDTRMNILDYINYKSSLVSDLVCDCKTVFGNMKLIAHTVTFP